MDSIDNYSQILSSIAVCLMIVMVCVEAIRLNNLQLNNLQEPERIQQLARRFKRRERLGRQFEEMEESDSQRFQEATRMDRDTFEIIFEAIEESITKEETFAQDTVPAYKRLAVALHRLTRGTYYYDIAQLYGIGLSTAQTITNEVCIAIIEKMWEDQVKALQPRNSDGMAQLQSLMDFPYAFAALDGCHIPITCPSGPAARRDHWNYKNFYSIVMLALVDGHGRFLWAHCGTPGNVHDSSILTSTNLWHRLPQLTNLNSTVINGIRVPALILADSAFPFLPYIMKRFSHSNLSPAEQNFNRLHSKSRVCVENAFGLLKMRFRELFRTSEREPYNVKYSVLACIVLHNIMINRRVPVPPPQPSTSQPEEPITFLNHSSAASRDTNMAARQVRQAILPFCQ